MTPVGSEVDLHTVINFIQALLSEFKIRLTKFA